MKSKKRKDECLFCTKRKCYTRIVSTDTVTFDEIACTDHSPKLHTYSDQKAPGVLKHFISSTGKQKRREPFVTEF